MRRISQAKHVYKQRIALLHYLMSLTASMLGFTGETRWSTSKWIFHLVNCLIHFSLLRFVPPWAGGMCRRQLAQIVCRRMCRAAGQGLHRHFQSVPGLSSHPTNFKTTTIVPVTIHSTATAVNDFHQVALTCIIAKCFDRLVLSLLKFCLPTTLEPHRFAYRTNRSTEDAISATLHSALTHLDCPTSYNKMLFDFSSTFNIMIPSKLTSKLRQLRISTLLCSWTFWLTEAMLFT